MTWQVLGIDPGVTTGWGVIELATPTSTPRALRWGTFRAEHERDVDRHLRDLLDALPLHALIGVEQIEGVAYSGKGAGIVPNLLHAKGIESRIRARADIWLAPRFTVDLPANAWKRILCGRGNADDKLVAQRLPLHLVGLGKSNEHARDALGLAVVVARRMMRPSSLSR